ncbi:MAG: hypothetical protein KDK55_06510 [Chlamydiia bacterium]|nr:hypothetical protein [Chlamydiia bacterium]
MKPNPFEFTSTILFVLAVLHTFLTPTFFEFYKKLSIKAEEGRPNWKKYHFLSELMNLFSEIEVVFGMWLIPLIIAFGLMMGWTKAFVYFSSFDYTDPLYIMVIFVVVGSRPIFYFAEKILEWVARLGGDRPGAWWWTILTIGPLLGALLKEPGAMALSSLLLVNKFYLYRPSRQFAYATLGLLFVNVSVGGMLTPFSSRALFVVAKEWGWGTGKMFAIFGWKAVLGVLISNLVYYLIFRQEFKRKYPPRLGAHQSQKTVPPPWLILVHLLFLAIIALTGEYAPIFIGIFILFLGLCKATSFYQTNLHLKSSLLVGFFFASLLIFGDLQSWWVKYLLDIQGLINLMGRSALLSAFVDNATVIYISTRISLNGQAIHYAIVAGAMAAGGLTIVANAPNLIGYTILRSSFYGKISFLRLFLGALIPTTIMLFTFWLFVYTQTT